MYVPVQTWLPYLIHKYFKNIAMFGSGKMNDHIV